MQLRYQLGAFELLSLLLSEIAQDAGEVAAAAGPPIGERQMRREDGPVLATNPQFTYGP